jgi:hypothetical protein
MNVQRLNELGRPVNCFAIASQSGNDLGLVSAFSTRSRADIALAENLHPDRLIVTRAQVWYAANGNVRLWKALPL